MKALPLFAGEGVDLEEALDGTPSTALSRSFLVNVLGQVPEGLDEYLPVDPDES